MNGKLFSFRGEFICILVIEREMINFGPIVN